MKTENLPLAIVAATVIGIVQTAILVYSWVYIAIYNPVPHWLTALGMHGTPHRAALFCTDFIFSVVLCFPAAFLLSYLRPRKLLVYLACAVVPGFLWQYSLLFEHPAAFRDFGQFIPGILYALLILPVTVFLVTRFRNSAHA